MKYNTRTPDRYLAIDESVVLFNGRVRFLQYLNGKPNPWGIKAFALSESVSGYLYKVRLYFGKDTSLERHNLPHTGRVLLTLVNGLHHNGYDLYVDHFYSSNLVAIELKKVGIILTNRKSLPDSCKSKSRKPRVTVEAFCCSEGGMLVTSWQDKRQVLMISKAYGWDG